MNKYGKYSNEEISRYFLIHSEGYMREHFFLSDFGAFFLKGHQREEYPRSEGYVDGVALNECNTMVTVDSEDHRAIAKYEWSARELTLENDPEYFI